MASQRLTKTQLLSILSAEIGIDKKTVTALLDALLRVAYNETKKKGEFVLPGIGKLVKQKRKARIGINPKTGEKIKIAAKTVVKMRLAKAAKDAVLGPATPAATSVSASAKKSAAPTKKTAASVKKAAIPVKKVATPAKKAPAKGKR